MNEFISNYYKRMSVMLWAFLGAALINGVYTGQVNIVNLALNWVIFSMLVYWAMGLALWVLEIGRKVVSR